MHRLVLNIISFFFVCSLHSFPFCHTHNCTHTLLHPIVRLSKIMCRAKIKKIKMKTSYPCKKKTRWNHLNRCMKQHGRFSLTTPHKNTEWHRIYAKAAWARAEREIIICFELKLFAAKIVDFRWWFHFCFIPCLSSVCSAFYLFIFLFLLNFRYFFFSRLFSTGAS